MKVSELLQRVDEGLLDKIKSALKMSKPAEQESSKAFNAAGDSSKHNISSWQAGWMACSADPSADPAHKYRKLSAEVSGLDRSSFIAGFNANAQSRGLKIYGDVGKSEVTSAALALKDFKRSGR